MTRRLMILALLAVFAISARAQLPPSIDLNVPSEAAGGGTLAMRLTFPPVHVGPRFAWGAPVVVLAPGGHGVGSLMGGEPQAWQGMVAVTFLFPGGSQGPFHSDGEFDYRGIRCQQALRDALLLAGGELGDELGRTIDQILPFPVLTSQVILAGMSNGGPISMAVLATYGGDLGFVKGYVGWENPTSGQTVNVEVGGKGYDCDPEGDGDGNGYPEDDGKNPYLTAYTGSAMDMEYDRLAYDPTYVNLVRDPADQHPPFEREGILFLDGNGNGSVDFVFDDPGCFDVNENGRLDVGEDYVFYPLASYEFGDVLLHYSFETTLAAFEHDVYDGAWPTDVATPEECDAYWSLRDATRFYEDLAIALPDLRSILAFRIVDHVQAADEHIHIQHAYDGLRGQALWCRLNPDECYYRLVDPNPPVDPTDWDADLPVSWSDMGPYSEPYELSSHLAGEAAVIEMAERISTNNWAVNLSEPAVIEAPIDLTRLALDVRPNPGGRSATVRWHLGARACGRACLRDVNGRLVGARTVGCSSAEGGFRLGDIFPRDGARGVYWLTLEVGPRVRARRVVVLP
jgi:hypothetical protein